MSRTISPKMSESESTKTPSYCAKRANCRHSFAETTVSTTNCAELNAFSTRRCKSVRGRKVRTLMNYSSLSGPGGTTNKTTSAAQTDASGRNTAVLRNYCVAPSVRPGKKRVPCARDSFPADSVPDGTTCEDISAIHTRVL